MLRFGLGFPKSSGLVRGRAHRSRHGLKHQPRALFDHLLGTLHRFEAPRQIRCRAFVPESDIGLLEVRIEAGQVCGCAANGRDSLLVASINGLLNELVALFGRQVFRV